MADLIKDGYKITDAPERKNDKQEELETPAYLQQLELAGTQKKRLSREFFLEHDAIDEEWKKEGLINKFDSLDNQYEGKLEENVAQQFNLHKHTTKVKIDAIVRAAKKAFLASDPVFSVSPRAENVAKENIVQICEAQQEYLDYKIDEGVMPFKKPMGITLHSSALKGVGILKMPHEIKREKRKREEYYKGTPMYLVIIPPSEPNGKPTPLPLMDHEQFKKIEKEEPQLAKMAQRIDGENIGLQDFLTAYPDALEEYPGYVQKLRDGKEIRIVVEYEETTYNDPLPKYVVLQNFRCRLSVEGNEGMKNTKLVDERMSYTWWELKQEEAKGKFYDIDLLKHEYDNKGKAKTKDDKPIDKRGHENETYDVFEAIFYAKIDEDDEEPTKMCLWIEEQSKKVIGATLYPYYGVDCYYTAFYVLNKWAGWLQPGVGEYLTDLNLAENAFLNFTLEGMYTSNMITPITEEGSEVDKQFLDKEWTHGIPLNAKPGEVDFLQKYMKPMDVGGLVAMMQIITRTTDDVSRVSSLVTGGESEIDPDAPARKTLALLKQSGINVEEYIENLLPSFNEVGKNILQLTYQMSKEGRKYKPKGKGKDFREITRSQMIARTNIESQAKSYNFDELNMKRELVAFFQMFRQEPLINRNPESVYYLLKAIIKKWSPMFKNIVDQILPSPQQFKQDQLKVSVQALAMYIKAKVEESQATGVKPEFDLQEIMGIMAQAQKELATAPTDDEMKEREKQAKG